MSDEAAPQSNPFLRALTGGGRRLYGRGLLLLIVGIVLAVFVAALALPWNAAIVGYLVVVAAALVLPSESAASSAPAETNSGVETAEIVMRRFADALADPCLLLDRRGTVLHRNEAASRQFPSTQPGAPLAFSMRQPAMLTALDIVIERGESQTIELHQTVPSETWHQVTVAPVHGGERYIVVTLRSLTDQRRVDAMRADFIANASHELRTPLTSLIGFVDTLLGPAAKDSAAREKFLRIMQAQGQRMSKLIDDLLSLSRIEMRQHVRPAATLDLTILLGEVCEGLGTQATEAGVAIELSLPQEPAIVSGDRDELYEVFENLIDNAIKYGGDGGKVAVELAAVANRPGFDYVAMVSDFGAGIAAEHVPRLTERFYRVDAESSRKKKGTGLGLAIVKHILARHRGQMTIRSQPGQGTRVEVLLPR